jgi:hypothetical protein
MKYDVILISCHKQSPANVDFFTNFAQYSLGRFNSEKQDLYALSAISLCRLFRLIYQLERCAQRKFALECRGGV